MNDDPDIDPENTDERHRRRLAAAAIVPLAVAALLHGDVTASTPPPSPPPGGGISDDEFRRRLEQVFAEADALAGPVAEDTRIVYERGSDVLQVGGLAFTFAPLGGDGYVLAAHTSWVHPARWPVLPGRQAVILSDADLPMLGVSVFAQTAVVSTAERRQELFDEAWRHLRLADADVVMQRSVSDPFGGPSCWAEVRRGVTDEIYPPVDHAVVLVGGDGVASWGVTIVAPPWYESMVQFTDDLVDAICGLRPPGS